MKVYKLFLPDFAGKQHVIYTKLDELVQGDLEPSEVGDVIRIEVAEMTQEQIDSLPEFDGW